MARDTRTKAELISECDRLRNQVTLNAIALQCLLNKQVDHTERCKMNDGTRYTLRLMRATGPSGGILAVTFHCEGQDDHTSVYYLEDTRMSGEHSNLFPSEHHDACAAMGRIFAARSRLCTPKDRAERLDAVLNGTDQEEI